MGDILELELVQHGRGETREAEEGLGGEKGGDTTARFGLNLASVSPPSPVSFPASSVGYPLT